MSEVRQSFVGIQSQLVHSPQLICSSVIVRYTIMGVDPQNEVEKWRGPQQGLGEPQLKLNLVHFSLEI